VAEQSAVYAKSRRSIRKRLPRDAACTGPTTAALNAASGMCPLVNIEKIAKGLKKTLPEIFGRV